MINLVTGDSRALMDAPRTLNSVCLSPFQIVLAMLLIYRELGLAAFAGFGGLFIMIPIGSKLRVLQRATQVPLGNDG